MITSTPGTVRTPSASHATRLPCGLLLDANGDLLDIPLGRRTLGIGVEQLRKIPRVVVVAVGPDKVPIIRAAVRSGLVNVIATDSTTMSAILERERHGYRH